MAAVINLCFIVTISDYMYIHWTQWLIPILKLKSLEGGDDEQLTHWLILVAELKFLQGGDEQLTQWSILISELNSL